MDSRGKPDPSASWGVGWVGVTGGFFEFKFLVSLGLPRDSSKVRCPRFIWSSPFKHTVTGTGLGIYNSVPTIFKISAVCLYFICAAKVISILPLCLCSQYTIRPTCPRGSVDKPNGHLKSMCHSRQERTSWEQKVQNVCLLCFA